MDHKLLYYINSKCVNNYNGITILINNYSIINYVLTVFKLILWFDKMKYHFVN